MTLDRLGNVLHRVSAELDRVADRLRAVTPHLDGLSAAASAPSASRIVGLQDLDGLEQTVREIAVALRSTAGSEAAASPIDVDPLVQGLCLSAIEDVIRGVALNPSHEGEVEFFA